MRIVVSAGRSIAAVVFWLSLLLCVSAVEVSDPDPETVIVLANENVPHSVELARYYMEKRGIPDDNLCILDLPENEIISRKLYDLRLRDPLLTFLRKGGHAEQILRDPRKVRKGEPQWETVRSSAKYLVSMYGVPLRIADSRLKLEQAADRLLGRRSDRDTAAVDSELALLLLPPYDLNSLQNNPLFNHWVRPATETAAEGLVLAAVRLDAADPKTVRGMIDDALSVERHGLQGRVYIDTRNIREEGYEIGDFWLLEAHERFLREGYECLVDTSPGMWSAVYPMEDVAVYMGWYSEHIVGPFTRDKFRFKPGAIAYHIHSSSARSIRTTEEYWAGPFLNLGAAVTMGAVSEPYLRFTPQLNLFADRLCRGNTFADSVYMSLVGASWQISAMGDPLYRPFRYSLDEQIRNMEADDHPDLPWGYLRKVNRMVRESRFNTALEFCRQKAEETGSPILLEKLGDLYARNELFSEAGKYYEEALEKAETPETAVRIGARWLLILRLLGETSRADELERQLREKWRGAPVLPWLETATP